MVSAMTNDTTNRSRRAFVGLITAGTAILATGRASADPRPAIMVWKDPNCGCCTGWVEHLRSNGFTATVIETANVQAIKVERGVPAELASCHTAEIAGYTIEGHVPARAILRLIAEKPSARGLAVPGMPIGSLGMEGGTWRLTTSSSSARVRRRGSSVTLAISLPETAK